MNSNALYTLSRACTFDRTKTYILGYRKGEAGTRVFRWTDRWDNYYVPFVSCGIAVLGGTDPGIITLGVDGSVHVAGPGGFSSEHVDRLSGGPAHRGALRDLRVIEGLAYCVGLGRQVYVRTTKDCWTRIDEGIVEPLGGDGIGGFESIDGFGHHELYAVGIAGEMYSRLDGIWSQIESPTNTVLTKVLCGSDGLVYVAGRDGMFATGRNESWQVHVQFECKDTIWDLAWHDDSVWASTKTALYRLSSGQLRLVDTTPAQKDFRYFATMADTLIAIGGRQVMSYVDGGWDVIDPPS